MSAADHPVLVDATYGCWLWQSHTDKRDGRALAWRGNKPFAAYRDVYEREVGPVPAERVLDHLCRRPNCVAPHHLEPVTARENELRKSWAYRCRRTTCAKGHSLEHAIVTPEMGKLCRVCNAEARA